MTTTQLLQTLIDGQVAIRKDIKRIEKKLTKMIKSNGTRIDKLGKQLAYLEDLPAIAAL